MTLRDMRDNPVSTTSRRALEHYEAALGLFNGYFNDPLAVIDAAMDEDPNFVMGHCFRAGLYLISTEKVAEPLLRHSVEAAEALAGRANDRERGHTAAARAWLDGDFQRAARLYGAVLIDHPRDMLALQVAHQCDFLLGQSALLRDRVAQVLPHWSTADPGYGYVLGMHAFGLEETGDYARAEATGRQAVGLVPRDAWGIHAVAHVMEMQGRQDEGVAWMTGRTEDWAPDNALAYHNWWHLALYHLDLGETARVLEIYDRGIRPGPSEVAMEMLDAASMLWRLHMRGIDVGDRWAELADTYEPMAEDAHYAFNDAHAMMAFTATGREAPAKRLLAVLGRRAAGTGTNAMMTRDVGLPVCQAIHAFGQGRYNAVVDTLMPVVPIASRFGGSHAQRDVLAQTLVEAALRAGRGRLARALIAERTDGKPSSPYNWLISARALELLGDRTGAEQARTRAAALREAITGRRPGAAAA